MSGELKPCPFCGSDQIEHNIELDGDASNTGIHWYWCRGCRASGPTVWEEQTEDYVAESNRTALRARRKWNTRAAR